MNDAWKSPEARTVVPALPSATVLLLRERDGAMEVMMVKRGAGAFFGSALVFPGGKVDEGDAHPGWDGFTEGGEGLDREQVALRVAGWREVYEETGALPASCTVPLCVNGSPLPTLAARSMAPAAPWLTLPVALRQAPADTSSAAPAASSTES